MQCIDQPCITFSTHGTCFFLEKNQKNVYDILAVSVCSDRLSVYITIYIFLTASTQNFPHIALSNHFKTVVFRFCKFENFFCFVFDKNLFTCFVFSFVLLDIVKIGVSVTWKEAELHCKKLGRHLISLDSWYKIHVMYHYQTKENADLRGWGAMTNFWIGMHDWSAQQGLTDVMKIYIL